MSLLLADRRYIMWPLSGCDFNVHVCVSTVATANNFRKQYFRRNDNALQCNACVSVLVALGGLFVAHSIMVESCLLSACLSVCVLTRVVQIITAAHKDC